MQIGCRSTQATSLSDRHSDNTLLISFDAYFDRPKQQIYMSSLIVGCECVSLHCWDHSTQILTLQ